MTPLRMQPLVLFRYHSRLIRNMSHPRFIVVFKKTASMEEIERIKNEITSTGGKVTHDYGGGVLNGFAAEIEPEYFQQLSTALDAGSTSIDYLEPDGEVTIQ